MSKYLKKFTDHTKYEEFMEANPPIKNVVSICDEENHVHYDEMPTFYNKLVFDGTAYINTEYVLPENCSIATTLGYETVRNQQYVFGNDNGNAATVGRVSLNFGGNTDSGNRQIVTYYQTNSYNHFRYLSFSYDSFSFFVTPKGSGNGNNFETYTKGNLVNSNPFLIGRCAPPEVSPTWSSYTGKTGDVLIYGLDAQNVTNYTAFASFTPIATFKPCIYKGKAGMWFVEEKRFCGNAADSGTLTVE